MSDVTINYKGSSLATMDASGSKTLLTEGKYCEDDIEVVYARPAGPSGTKQISISQNGTTTEDVAAYANAEITVNVSGGGSSNSVADMFPIPDGYTLPSNYQKLAYCDSSGTQIFNTGVVATLDTKIEFDGFFLPGTYGAYLWLLGSTAPSVYISQNDYNVVTWSGFGNSGEKHIGATNRYLYGVPTHSISASEFRIKTPGVFDVAATYTATSMQSGSDTIVLLGRNNNGVYDKMAPARFYRARIWEGNTLIRCIVPVLKDGTEVCLYDVVNGTYMPNLGTGVLTGAI